MEEVLPGAAELPENRMAVVSWLERVGVKCLGRLLRAVDVGFHDAGIQSARRTTSRPSWTPDALRLRFGLPTCVSLQPPAKFPPCPCVSCCAALEASFSLFRLPGLSLNTCACLACATPRYRRPARTYLEYNTRKRNTHRTLIPTLRTRESPGGYP
jgi:hypothetical protein